MDETGQSSTPARSRPRCRTCGELRKGHPRRCPLLETPAPVSAQTPSALPSPSRIVNVNHTYAYVGTQVETDEGVVYNANLQDAQATPVKQHHGKAADKKTAGSKHRHQSPNVSPSNNRPHVSDTDEENGRNGSDEDERDDRRGPDSGPGKFAVWIEHDDHTAKYEMSADAYYEDGDGIIRGGMTVPLPADWPFARSKPKERWGGIWLELALACIVGMGGLVYFVWRRSVMQLENTGNLGLAARYNLRPN